MKTRLIALFAAVASLALLAPLSATAEPTLAARSHTLYFGAGCPPANPAGSCASTEYFLSRVPGESNIGSLISAVDWTSRATGGGYSMQDYPGDETLNDTYILRGGTKLDGQIVVGGWVGGAELAVDSGVRVVVTAHEEGAQLFDQLTLADVEVVKTVVTPGDRTYTFSVDIPMELDGVVIDGLDAAVGHNSATLMTNGWVNGSGDSYFKLRYWEVIGE